MSKPLEANPLDPELIEEFVEEAENAIEEMESGIEALHIYVFDEVPESVADVEAFLRRHPLQPFHDSLKTINRMLHSLKGLSAMVGLEKFSRYCHSMEEVTTGIACGKHLFTSHSLLLLKQMPSTITGMIDQIIEEKTDAEVDIESKIPVIQECLNKSVQLLQGQTIDIRNLHNQDHGEIRQSQRQIKINISISEFDKLVQDFQAFSQNTMNILNGSQISSDIISHINMGFSYHLNSLVLASQTNIVLNRYFRMVDDLSRTLGKEAVFRIKRNTASARPDVWDKAHLALVHLIRNSLDHGIETPDLREKAGKDRKGCISIDIYDDHKSTYLNLEDDGAGIDPEKIREIIKEKGIFAKEILKEMDDNAVQKLIFHPGFSTKKETTRISGRGVGLDAALEEIQVNLNGRIDLESVPGKGSLFKIEIPKTEVLSECIIFGNNDVTYGLPLLNKVEYLDFSIEKVRKIPKKSPMYDHSHSSFQIVDIMSVLHPESYSQFKNSQATIILTEDANGKRLGILVPSVKGHQHLKIYRNEKLKKMLGDKEVVFGFTLTDPIIVILNPEFLKMCVI